MADTITQRPDILTESKSKRPGDHHAHHKLHFDERHALHELKHFLPSQNALKDFIHHNSLHPFQNLKFYDAIFKAAGIFGYQVTLQLTEYRELYQIGRIKHDILEKTISDRNIADRRLPIADLKSEVLLADFNRGLN